MKIIQQFSKCREKDKIYRFVKKCYEAKVDNMKNALIQSGDIGFAIQILNNLRYHSPVIQDKLVPTAKDVYKHTEITQLTSSVQIIELINAIQPFIDKSDTYILDSVYEFYKEYPYLFDKHQIDRLQYYYYSIGTKIEFSDPVEFQVIGDSVTNTRMYTPVILKLMDIKPNKCWNYYMRYNEETQTSTANISHKSGKHLQISGVFPNSYEDIGIMRSQLPNFQQFFLGLAPLPIEYSGQKMGMLKDIHKSITMNQKYNDKYPLVDINIPEYIEKIKKELFIVQSQNLISGIQQGYEVPFTHKSLVYGLRELDAKVILTDLNFEERCKLLLTKIDDIADEIQLLRMRWLNSVMEWTAQVQKTGCFTCGTQPTGVQTPSQILNSHVEIQQIRAQFIKQIVMAQLQLSECQKSILFVDQDIYNLVLKEILQSDFEQLHTNDINEYRQKVFDALNIKNQNSGHLNALMQFYKEYKLFYKTIFLFKSAEYTKEIYKLCSNELTDLNTMYKKQYEPGIQIKCGAREILF